MRSISLMIKPVSGMCNMCCRYCFYADEMSRRKKKTNEPMPLELLETIVRRAFRYADGPVSFAFQGGEPTLAGLPFYEALVRFQREYNARSLPVSNSIQTNGCCLSDEMIDFLAREHFLTGISLDGIPVTHDAMRVDQKGLPTWERVTDSIRRLSRAGVSYNVLCVVNEYVAVQPEQVFRELSMHGYLQFITCLDDLDGIRKPWSLTSESYLGFLKTIFDLYYEAYQKGKYVSIRNFDNYIQLLAGAAPESCAMSGRCGHYYLIESDGSVYPCDFYALDEWRLGSVAEQSFHQLDRSGVGMRFRERSFPLPEQCRVCEWYLLCRNGCMRERDPVTGINRWCECFRSFFAFSYPRMKQIALETVKGSKEGLV